MRPPATCGEGAGRADGEDVRGVTAALRTVTTMAACHLPVLALSLLAVAGDLDWREGPPMPVALGNHAAAVVDGQVLVAGGTTWRDGRKLWLSDVWASDLKAGNWRRLGDLPEPVGGAATIAAGNALYVIGGSDGVGGSCRCWRLRLEDGGLSVRRLPDLPEPRVYAAGARVGRYLCVVGGCTDTAALDTAARTLFALNLMQPDQGWQELARIPGPARVIHAAAGDLRSLYVFGGCHLDDAGKVRNLADAWCYQMDRSRWARLPDLPAACRGLTALGLGHRGVLLIGGYTATVEEAEGQAPDFGFSADVLRYDPGGEVYRELGRLPRATACVAAVRVGGEVAVLGGEPAMRQRADRVWLTDRALLLRTGVVPPDTSPMLRF